MLCGHKLWRYKGLHNNQKCYSWSFVMAVLFDLLIFVLLSHEMKCCFGCFDTHHQCENPKHNCLWCWCCNPDSPEWSPSDKWTAWTQRCCGRPVARWPTWRFWWLRWAASWKRCLPLTPHSGPAMWHLQHWCALTEAVLGIDTDGQWRTCYEGTPTASPTLFFTLPVPDTHSMTAAMQRSWTSEIRKLAEPWAWVTLVPFFSVLFHVAVNYILH